MNPRTLFEIFLRLSVSVFYIFQVTIFHPNFSGGFVYLQSGQNFPPPFSSDRVNQLFPTNYFRDDFFWVHQFLLSIFLGLTVNNVFKSVFLVVFFLLAITSEFSSNSYARFIPFTCCLSEFSTTIFPLRYISRGIFHAAVYFTDPDFSFMHCLTYNFSPKFTRYRTQLISTLWSTN